jgi:N-acetylneuraminic acid mutarotase
MLTGNILLLFSFYLIQHAHAYFYVPTFMSNLPFQDGMAYAQRNNSLVLFGGENATDTYTNNMYQLTQLSDTFSWETLNQTNTPPGMIYGQSIIHQDTMHVFGGITNSTSDQFVPLQHYQYSFQNQSWSSSTTNTQTISLNSTTMPLNRKLFSSTFDGTSKVYFYGGALNESIIFSDFWSFDINTSQYTRLPNINLPRYAHSASYLRYQ